MHLILLATYKVQATSPDDYPTNQLDKFGTTLQIAANSFSQAYPVQKKIKSEQQKLYKFIDEFKNQAQKHGINPVFYDKTMANIIFDQRIAQKNAHQPEFSQNIWTYLNSAISNSRIRTGKQKLLKNKLIFAEIEKIFQVDREIITAIWGMESAFGRITGNYDVINSLANLAYDGRRRKFAKTQLIASLKILQDNLISRSTMKGSWAGAMGQTQFIPTTYLDYAIDFNNDGKRDLWKSLDDVLASTANYLSRSKYKNNQPWGIEVFLPSNFNYSLTGLKHKKTVQNWRKIGVKITTAKHLWQKISSNHQASLIIPAGAHGPAFLVFNNFHAILKYNRSTSYALAVGLLANRIAGLASPIIKKWPINEKPLNLKQRKLLQRHLVKHGYLKGKVDGIIGTQTKSAIKLWQKDNNIVPDGYASTTLLNYIP